MRYILLFIIAVLLPVFGFLNFDSEGDSYGRERSSGVFTISKPIEQVRRYMAPFDRALGSLLGSETSEKALSGTQEGQNQETASANTASISEAVSSGSGGDNALGADSGNIVYKVPKIKYTEPAQFPLTATLSQPYLDSYRSPNFFPIRDWSVKIDDIDSAAALAIEPVTHKALYYKSIFEPRSIASLTKLMTALIVIEEMDLLSEVRISEAAVASYGDQGDLAVGEDITVESLLYILLISSSNDAAFALEEYYNSLRIEEDKTFVAAMNKRARELGLLDTFFVEPSGLDPGNHSSAYDLARLGDYVFQRPILRQIMSTQVIDVQSVDGIINHHLVNSNKLLGVLSGVLAGKTGYTEEAGESIILFVKKSDDLDDYLIYVILGSDDRVKSARHLIDWVAEAYIWE